MVGDDVWIVRAAIGPAEDKIRMLTVGWTAGESVSDLPQVVSPEHLERGLVNVDSAPARPRLRWSETEGVAITDRLSLDREEAAFKVDIAPLESQ